MSVYSDRKYRITVYGRKLYSCRLQLEFSTCTHKHRFTCKLLSAEFGCGVRFLRKEKFLWNTSKKVKLLKRWE